MFVAFNVNFIITVNLYPFSASDIPGHDFSHLGVVGLSALPVKSTKSRAGWRLDDQWCTLNKLLPVIFNFNHIFRTLRRTLLVTIFIFHLMLNLENNLLAVSRWQCNKLARGLGRQLLLRFLLHLAGHARGPLARPQILRHTHRLAAVHVVLFFDVHEPLFVQQVVSGRAIIVLVVG